MEYKLSRQSCNISVNSLVKREVKRQDVFLARPSAQILKGIFESCAQIKKKGLPDSLVCKKLPNKLGKGIFLHPKAKPILRGQVIAPYAGVLKVIAQNDSEDSDYAFAPMTNMILTKEEQKTFDPKKRYHPRRLYALDLDAERIGNFTRFINHSDEPNIEARLMKIPVNCFGVESSPIEVIYIAKKTIHPGEQLLVCYEDDSKGYWGVLGIDPFAMTPKTFMLDASLKLTKN